MRISDWSSDVCSSDLADFDVGQVIFQVEAFFRQQAFGFGGRLQGNAGDRVVFAHHRQLGGAVFVARDRESAVEGTSVSVRVDLGVRRIIKKKISKDITSTPRIRYNTYHYTQKL